MIKEIISLTVPHYIILAVATIFLNNFLINKNFPDFYLLVGIILLSASIVSFNMFNMTQDIKLDSYKKKNRPLVSGFFKKKNVLLVSSAIYLVITLIIISNFSNILNYWPVLLFIIFSILYTAPKIYLKRYFLSSNIFGMTLYSVFPILLIFTTTQQINWFYFCFFSGIMFFIATTKEFEDQEIEKKNKFMNLTILFGLEKTKKIIIFGINSILIFGGLFSLIWQKEFVIPILASLILNNTILKSAFKQKMERNIISQSKIVTTSMEYFIGILLLFCLNQFLLIVF